MRCSVFAVTVAVVGLLSGQSALGEAGEKADDVPVRSDIIEGLSFAPPFDAFDAEGSRVVGDFMHGGSADVKKNYVRLTPDRAVRSAAKAVLRPVWACFM